MMGGVTEPSELLVVEVVMDKGAFGVVQLQYNFGRLHSRQDVEARILSKLLKLVLILFSIAMFSCHCNMKLNQYIYHLKVLSQCFYECALDLKRHCSQLHYSQFLANV